MKSRTNQQQAYVARVFPSRAALNQRLDQELNLNPSGVLLRPQYYVFDELLPKLLNQVETPGQAQALTPWAGPVLVQDLITKQAGEGSALSGVASGRKLPDRLWRLLVEIKAAGLKPSHISELQSSAQSIALAWLLEAYNRALADLHLCDQADLMDALQARLSADQDSLPILNKWARLIVHDALWLRTLDLRLLRTLSLCLPVEVRFSFTPQEKDPLFKLLNAGARYLEAERQGNLQIVWPDQAPGDSPIARIVMWAINQPGGDYRCEGHEALELERCAGRYSEVESLVYEALALLESGVEPGDIALVFPDVTVYGQMAADVASRVGLPLDPAEPRTLLDSPLVQAVLSLLQLALGDFPASDLARVLESPYLNIAAWFSLSNADMSRTTLLLSLAGYVDGREGFSPGIFERAAQKNPAYQAELLSLAKLLPELKAKLDNLAQASDFESYLTRVQSLCKELRLDLAAQKADGFQACPGPNPARLAVRDLMAWQEFQGVLSRLAQAAGQVQAGQDMSGGRNLALLRQVLGQSSAPRPGSTREGVRLLSLEDAAGLKLHTVLIGGLSQSAFPSRPQSQHMLSSGDRLQLGKTAQIPVWRTDEEEYSGQQLNLARLMASAQHKVHLTYPASGPDGQESEPAFWFADLARGLKRELSRPQSGAFGALPGLEQCRDRVSLWASLSQAVSGPQGSKERLLAQAVLDSLAAPHAQAVWQSIARRSAVERKRLELDHLSLEQRFAASDLFSGRIGSAPALAILKRVMSSAPLSRINATSLESLAMCPMNWFFAQILGLSEAELAGWELSPSGEGEWVHETMARFFEPGDYSTHWDESQIRGRLMSCLHEAKEHLIQTGGMGHPSIWAGRQTVLEASLFRVAQAEMESLPPARPWGVEKRFGGDQADTRIMLPVEGAELELAGRLDRLDTAPGQIRITDYKHTKNTTYLNHAVDEEAQGRTAFQLAVYLAAALSLSQETKVECLARVVPTRLASRKPGIMHYGADSMFLAPPGTPGADAQNNLFAAIRALWERTWQGDLTPRPDGDTCRYCQVQGVCRARALILGAEGET